MMKFQIKNETAVKCGVVKLILPTHLGVEIFVLCFCFDFVKNLSCLNFIPNFGEQIKLIFSWTRVLKFFYFFITDFLTRNTIFLENFHFGKLLQKFLEKVS